MLMPGVVIGVIIGAAIANIVNADGLKMFFALSQLFFGSYMLIRQDKSALYSSMPPRWASLSIEAVIGCISALKGVGGGVQNVLFMTLCNVPIHRAVATASAIGVVIASAGSVSYMVIGWDEAGLPPYSLGYVSLIGFALIAAVSVFTAPLGAKLAHFLPVKRLKMYFSIFMLGIAAKMLLEVF